MAILGLPDISMPAKVRISERKNKFIRIFHFSLFRFSLKFRIFARMNARRLHIFLLLLLMTLPASAQKDFFLFKAARSVKNYLDSSVIKSVDSNYIAVPKKPWQLIVRHKIDQMRITMHSVVDDDDVFLDWTPTVVTNAANSVGLWLGYRGYGLGYSFSVSKHSDYNFTIGAVGVSYGINLRLRTINTKDLNADVFLKVKKPIDKEEAEGMNGNFDIELYEPIRVHSLVIDGYYMFNHKRFSYAAAYDQSNEQIRSAGSFMVGALWNAMSVRYNSDKNTSLVDMMKNVGAFKIRQGSIGAGYAYNWVPVRGLLINAMVMPMLTLYNRQVVISYKADYGDTEDDDMLYDENETTHWSRVALTYNARASITYNFERFFFNVYGQWNSRSYKYGHEGDGRVKDWFINTSIGYRF